MLIPRVLEILVEVEQVDDDELVDETMLVDFDDDVWFDKVMSEVGHQIEVDDEADDIV